MPLVVARWHSRGSGQLGAPRVDVVALVAGSVDRLRSLRDRGVPGWIVLARVRWVSKGARRRRSSGHPAKRGTRSGRVVAARAGGGGEPNAVAREIVREAAALRGALEAELWGSALLGVLWKRRFDLEPGDFSRGPTMVYGEPLIRAVAGVGGSGAAVALRVIAAVDDGELGMLVGELCAGLAAGSRLPGWVEDVGQAEIVAAAVMREEIFEDGFTVFLEARHPEGDRHAVGVYIDNNLGVVAKDILLADSIQDVERVMREHPPPDGRLVLEPVAAGVAAGQIHAAIELTDTTLGLDVGEEFADLRTLALTRGDEARDYEPVGERPALEQHARDRLLDEFLSSPEGAGIARDSDEAFVAILAIDFAADHADGRPLRWSPVLVELFMVDWLPRKVINPDGVLATLPAALEAWIRFAGRTTAKPAWAIDTTVDAIGHWHQAILDARNGPTVPASARRLLKAASQADIDFNDQAQLAAFIADRNEHPRGQ